MAPAGVLPERIAAESVVVVSLFHRLHRDRRHRHAAVQQGGRRDRGDPRSRVFASRDLIHYLILNCSMLRAPTSQNTTAC